MTPDEILAAWISLHGDLTEERRERFLERDEVTSLGRYTNTVVLGAIARSPKLAEALQIANAEGWWFSGEPCEDDGMAWCARCKPHPFPSVVVITRGWSAAFHRTEDCKWLVRGQSRVDSPAPVERVAVQVALGEGRQPCLSCLPQR